MAQQLSQKIQGLIDYLQPEDDSKEEQKNNAANDFSRKLTLQRIKQSGNGFAVVADPQNRKTAKRRVFLRADLNVPLNKENGTITDDTRIVATIPTLIEIFKLNPDRLVVTSHLGRPAGNPNEKLSLAPVAQRLEELLNKQGVKRKVILIKDWFRDDLNSHLNSLNSNPQSTIYLLENARFYIEEEGKGVDLKSGNKIKADKDNVKKFHSVLTSITDLYVNDAFGTCHRGHSTMIFDAPLRVAGLLVTKELRYFGKATSNPSRPYLAILGGAKVSDKILVIENLMEKVDKMMIVGGMAYTFLKIRDNVNIGNSLFDENASKEIVPKILDMVKKKGDKFEFLLPIDSITGDKFSADCKTGVSDDKNNIPDGYMGLDIGEKTCKLFSEKILECSTIVWNGPPGVFEFENFQNGTKTILNAVKQVTKTKGAITIVGGGDSAAATNKFGFKNDVSHVSTGGGASLELLEGKILPGVKALSDKK